MIGIKERKHWRKYSVNESFFEKLDADSAYVLGYVWTDGCLFNFAKKGGQSSWGLLLECQERDREILENVRIAMGSNAPIKSRVRISPKTGKELRMVRLSIYSRKIAEDLMRYGVIPRKSKSDPVIVGVSDDLIFHFIRGVFDGDGSVGFETRSPHQRRLTFTGKKSLLEWVDNQFAEKLGTKRRVIYRSSSTALTRSECWMIVYSISEDIQKIASALYQDAKVFLERKKDKLLVAKAA
jgi:hypothetical protein